MKMIFLVSILLNSLVCIAENSEHAKQLSLDFIQHFSPEQFELIDDTYSDSFFDIIDRATWVKALNNVYYELGAIHECGLLSIDKGDEHKKLYKDKVDIKRLRYACEHEKYSSEITFLIEHVESINQPKIRSIYFNSIGLIIE